MSDKKLATEMNEIYLAPAPHVVTPVSTSILMRNVIIALMPVTLFAVYLYGFSALIRIIISIATTVLCESGFRRLINRDIRIKDNSAIITGLLLALVMPPSIPIWILILSAMFGILVGKEFFGGLGQNPFNPALIGRAFAFVSFASPMTSWSATRASTFFGGLSGNFQNAIPGATQKVIDSLAGATPLGAINPIDGVAATASEIATRLGLESSQALYLDLFFGNHRGCMGETSILLILIGLVFLLATKTINWRIPVSMIGSAAILAFILGSDPLLTVLSGGLVFGAVFMATDYVTSPVTPVGRLIFGAGCGILTVVMRNFSANPEGVMFSILIMNSMVTFLNKIITRKYGYGKWRAK